MPGAGGPAGGMLLAVASRECQRRAGSSEKAPRSQEIPAKDGVRNPPQNRSLHDIMRIGQGQRHMGFESFLRQVVREGDLTVALPSGPPLKLGDGGGPP